MNLDSTVSSKGLVTIPKKIREQLKIQKGDKIYWIMSSKTKSELIVVHDPLDSLTGKYTEKGFTYKDLEGKADELLSKKVEKESP
ncbi:MAG: AbrB/MazE/SpoVT family DNA-binding domain-containing protein [Promethearchaeia archaeon]